MPLVHPTYKPKERKSTEDVLASFPAGRVLFSVVFAERTGVRKRDLCPGLKRTLNQPLSAHAKNKVFKYKTQLFRTSTFVGPVYRAALLSQGWGRLFLSPLLFFQPIMPAVLRAAN